MIAIKKTMEYLGGQAWQALDDDTKKKQLDRMKPLALIPVPHWNVLLGLFVSPAFLEFLARN